MGKARRFEDLVCWQKGRELANAVQALASRPAFARDFGLRGQIENASGSVMRNIAEGQDAGSDAEFVRFLRIARRAASEVQSELYLALDREYISKVELQEAYSLADETKRLMNGLISYLRKGQSGFIAGNQIHEAGEPYTAEEFEPNHP